MRKSVIAGLAAAAGGWFLAGRRRQPMPKKLPREIAVPAEANIQRYVAGAITPIWIAAGLADYFWHRRTKIETTSGVTESLLHSLMLVEAAPLVLGGLLLEINAGVLAFMIAAYAIHEATAIGDVSYTVSKREIPPGEQHVHSFLEMLPFTLVSLYAALHWDQFLALLGLGKEKARFEIRLKEPRLKAHQVAAIIAAITVVDGLPHAEELARCLAARRRKR